MNVDRHQIDTDTRDRYRSDIGQHCRSNIDKSHDKSLSPNTVLNFAGHAVYTIASASRYRSIGIGIGYEIVVWSHP